MLHLLTDMKEYGTYAGKRQQVISPFIKSLLKAWLTSRTQEPVEQTKINYTCTHAAMFVFQTNYICLCLNDA